MSKQDEFNKHATRMAANLRKMADSIEHELTFQDHVSDTAQAIIGIVTNGFSNLGLGLLLRWTVRVLEQSNDE